MPHYTFYLASRKFADTYPETAKQVVDELGKLSAWANSHQDEAAGLLSTSTGLDKAIWLKTLARLPYGAERMTRRCITNSRRWRIPLLASACCR